MEGYLIRLPSRLRNGRRRSGRPTGNEARLLYYVLGEGYMRGFTVPDAPEPVDVVQLTGHRIEVEPVFALHQFEVRLIPKASNPDAAAAENRQRVAENSDDGSNSSSSSDDDDHALHLPRRLCRASRHAGDGNVPPPAGTKTVLFFAVDKDAVTTWSNKILNWHRHVFDAFGDDEEDATASGAGPMNEASLATARNALVAQYRQLNPEAPLNMPMLAVTTGPIVTMGTQPIKTLDGFDDAKKAEASVDAANSKPWWMLGSSSRRRINAMTMNQ